MSKINLSESDIINAYNLKKSQHQLAKKYKCSRSVIRRILIGSGVKLRNTYERCRWKKVNQSYFDTIDSQDKAYFLGLMYADGSIKWRKGAGYIQLAMVEKELLSIFKTKLDSEHRITKEKNNRSRFNQQGDHLYFLRIGSTALASRLTKLGCKANKTHDLTFPSSLVPEELLPHFIRGYFDGDGSVSINKKKKFPYVQLSVTNSLGTTLQSLLDAVGMHFCISRDKSIWRLTAKYRVALRFLDFIYANSTVHLKRKYQVYLKIKDNYGH